MNMDSWVSNRLLVRGHTFSYTVHVQHIHSELYILNQVGGVSYRIRLVFCGGSIGRRVNTVYI